jgi:hypothetical protein
MDPEIKRLQGCINDLIAIVALPAMWSGHDPAEILDALVAALVRTLHLDLAYARAADAVVVRQSRRSGWPIRTRTTLSPWRSVEPSNAF